MRTKMMFAALVMSVALSSRAFSAEPAAPATPPAAVPAVAAAAPAPPACKKPYFADWVSMKPVRSLIAELKTVGSALVGENKLYSGQ